MEDALLFSRYYGNEAPLSDVFGRHFTQNYVTLLSNLFSWGYAYADVRLHPYLYQLTGFLFGLVASCMLFFSGLIKSRSILLIGPSLMGLTAMNHIFYFSTLIYVMYTGIIILLALPFLPAPRTPVAFVFCFLLMIFLPWSGPYSVIIIPVGLAFLFLFPRSRTKWLLLMVALLSTFCYFSFAVAENSSRLDLLKKWWVIEHFFHILLDKIIFMRMFDHVSMWLWIPVLLVIAICFFLFHGDRYYIRYSLIMFGIIISSLALFFLSNKFKIYLVTSDCHRVISLYFWCFYLLYTADHFLIEYDLGKFSAILLISAVTLLIIADNQRFPHKRWIKGIADTGEFLAAVKDTEQHFAVLSGSYVILQLNSYQRLCTPTAIIGDRSSGSIQMIAEQLVPEKRNRFILNRPLSDEWLERLAFLPHK